MSRALPQTASAVLRDIFAVARIRHLKQKTIAHDMRVTRECVSNWKRGASTPDILTVEELAQSLGYRLVLMPLIDDSA